jgi:cysteinyl-tRNA synthetase
MHNGMLELGSEEKGFEKMAKSVGNIRGLGEVLDTVEPEVLVLFFSAGHYRQPIAFSDERLEDAKRAAGRIRGAGRRLVSGPSPDALTSYRDGFFDALRNDFNTAEALASLYGWVREANRSETPVGDSHLREMLGVLGLEGLLAADAERPPEEVVELAALREEARRNRDWAEADRLRDELRALGWEVRDGPDGPELVRAA